MTDESDTKMEATTCGALAAAFAAASNNFRVIAIMHALRGETESSSHASDLAKSFGEASEMYETHGRAALAMAESLSAGKEKD